MHKLLELSLSQSRGACQHGVEILQVRFNTHTKSTHRTLQPGISCTGTIRALSHVCDQDEPTNQCWEVPSLIKCNNGANESMILLTKLQLYTVDVPLADLH